MRRITRIGRILCVLILILGGLWWYWERPLPLHDLLPEETWVRMELEQISSAGPAEDWKFVDPPMDAVLAALPGIRVTRAEARPYLDDNCFRITLYKGEAWPTVLYVGSTGRIDIAAELNFEDWKCYEGGEALYQYLSVCSKTLTAVTSVENS